MSVAELRSIALLAPLLITVAAWRARAPGRRERGALFLACCWNLAALLPLNLVAEAAGWWRFEAEGGTLGGFPVDLWIGWALLWGALPPLLAPRAPLALVVCAAALLDALAMPRTAPLVQLGPQWWIGELTALGVVLLPGLLAARWTVERRRLRCRALVQLAAFGGLAFLALPAAALEQAPGWAEELATRPRWLFSLQLQLIGVALVFGLAALQDFVERGGGTPFPYDPPTRLVTSGPYRYVANPMQLSMSLALALVGWTLSDGWIALAGLLAAVYGAGFARWHEEQELPARFPERWSAYRRAVRAWVPRLRPPGPGERAHEEARAVLYVAAGCAPCSALGRWIAARRPRGLGLAAAEHHPRRDLERLTYDPGDGAREEQGVRALARALEHLHLGWALVGFALRLPVVASFAQAWADAAGLGPRRIAREVDPGRAGTARAGRG